MIRTFTSFLSALLGMMVVVFLFVYTFTKKSKAEDTDY